MNKLVTVNKKTVRNGSKQRKIMALDSIESDGFIVFTFWK